MGISNRDYYRDDGFRPRSMGRPGRGSSLSAVGWIITITAAVYVLQLIAGDRSFEFFDLDPRAVAHGQLWRLVTYDFLHDRDSVWHVVFNMLILYMTGQDLEARRGSREFTAFYLLAGVISGIAFVVWSYALGPFPPAIGASGAVSAVMIVYAITYPHEIWRIWGILPVPVWAVAALVVILDLHPMLLQLGGQDVDDGVAHAAHIGGILFGVLYQRQNWWLTNWAPATGLPSFKKMFRRKPKLRVHRPAAEEPDFSSQVDALLDKIARQGEASLTTEERSVLMEASRRARERMSR